jgi:hypothetical protein
LRDHAFGDSDTVSSDSAYQEAWSFTLDVASSNSARGRRADAYLSRAESLELKISAIEREGGDRFGFNSLLGAVNPICPPGTLFSACAIASCDLARGVTCAQRDASSIAERQEKLFDKFVRNLERGVSLAATTAIRKQQAKEIKSARTSWKTERSKLRKKFGWAVFCK